MEDEDGVGDGGGGRAAEEQGRETGRGGGKVAFIMVAREVMNAACATGTCRPVC